MADKYLSLLLFEIKRGNPANAARWARLLVRAAKMEEREFRRRWSDAHALTFKWGYDR